MIHFLAYSKMLTLRRIGSLCNETNHWNKVCRNSVVEYVNLLFIQERYMSTMKRVCNEIICNENFSRDTKNAFQQNSLRLFSSRTISCSFIDFLIQSCMFYTCSHISFITFIIQSSKLTFTALCCIWCQRIFWQSRVFRTSKRHLLKAKLARFWVEQAVDLGEGFQRN